MIKNTVLSNKKKKKNKKEIINKTQRLIKLIVLKATINRKTSPRSQKINLNITTRGDWWILYFTFYDLMIFLSDCVLPMANDDADNLFEIVVVVLLLLGDDYYHYCCN